MSTIRYVVRTSNGVTIYPTYATAWAAAEAEDDGAQLLRDCADGVFCVKVFTPKTCQEVPS